MWLLTERTILSCVGRCSIYDRQIVRKASPGSAQGGTKQYDPESSRNRKHANQLLRMSTNGPQTNSKHRFRLKFSLSHIGAKPQKPEVAEKVAFAGMGADPVSFHDVRKEHSSLDATAK
jgi:hypothetical protein